MNFGWQPDDPPRRFLRHFFLHRHRHSAKIDSELVRLHSHDCAHARAERGGDQIGRRKCFAFASIVGWGVGFEGGLRRSVHRIAMEVASVLNGNFDHVVIMRRVAIFVMSSKVETSVASGIGNASGLKARPRPAAAALRYGLDCASLRSE